VEAKMIGATWVFNENTCVFQNSTLDVAAESFAAVWRDFSGTLWARVDEQVRIFQDDDVLLISGVEFRVEQFTY
jgi:hypothetical protein